MARGLRTRATICALGFVIAGLIAIGVVPNALAAPCPSGVGPFGGCFINVLTYPGEFPFGITHSDLEQKIIVNDLYSGIFYKFSKDPNDPGFTTHVSPLGLAQVTGLSYHTTEGVLYWVIDDGAGQVLVTSDTFGTVDQVIGPIASPLPNGLIGDITYHDETESFWGIDIVNDIYFEFDETAALTGMSFASPGTPPDPIGGGSYGTGITQLPGDGISTFFDIPLGVPIDGRAEHVERVDSTGAPIGLFYDLDADNNVTGWVTGIVWVAEGTPANPGIEVEYLVDVDGNRIVEVPAVAPSGRSVTGLAASADDVNSVSLSWNNSQPYLTITIERDGQVIDTLLNPSPGLDSYVDEGLEDGTYTYELTPATAAGTELPTAEISIVVGFGRLLGAVELAGDNPFGVTVVESSGLVYVTDLDSGQTERYSKDLVLQDTIASPFGNDNTTGIAWRNTTDTLFWINADANVLQETDLAGAPIGAPIDFPSPIGGIHGDISYDEISDTFWGVDILANAYFNFDASGAVLSSFNAPSIGPGNTIHGNGIAVVGGIIAFLDLPLGTDVVGMVDRVARANPDGSLLSIEYATGPSTLSGFLNGVAWTPAGSTGASSEYLVGNDTNTLYEVSLDVVIGTPFKRGDANNTGSVELSDATFVLNFLFGGGPAPDCFDAADANDVALVDLTDATYILNFLFGGGPPPPAPGPTSCALDPTDADSVPCVEYSGC